MVQSMQKSASKLTFKVCVIGDGGTGKTTLCIRVSTGHFKEDYKMTIGTTFFNYQTRIQNSIITFQLWDLGGQFQFRSILETFVRGAKAIILTFDSSNINSFMSLDADWTPFIKKILPRIPVMLVSTKHDLENANVPKDLVKEFIETSNLKIAGYIPTSSKTGQNIENVFYNLAEYLRKEVESNPR